MNLYITYDDFDLLKAIKKASGKITRKQAKAVHKDLPPGGVWRTIRGHHVYILNGKIVGGATFLQGKASKLDEDTHKKIQDFVTKRAKKDALNELRDHVMQHGVSHDDLMEKFGHSDVHRQALQEYAQKHGIADHEAVNNWNKIRSNRGKQDTHYRARAGLHKDYHDWRYSLSDDEKKQLIQDVAKHKLNSYILYLKWRKNHKELLKDPGDEGKQTLKDYEKHLPKELDPTKRKPLEAVDEVLKQIQTGKMSAANLHKFVDIYMSNREAITNQIYNENVKQNPAHKRRRDTTKRRIAEDMYTYGLMSVERHAFGNTRILWQGDRATVSAERLKHLSDDDLKQRYLDAYASKEERLAALPEKYKNPTTLEEYRYKQSRVGLSPEEEKQLYKLYDEEEHKRATQSWNKREQEQQQAEQTAQQTQLKPKVTSTSSDYTMHEDIHTKTGAKLHIIKPNKRLSKDEFNQLRNTIKRDHGGYYSKFKRGFIMPSKEEAEKFMSKQGGSAPATEAPKEQPKKAEAPHKQQANKLRELADKMQEQINHLKYNTDRKTDTHRRAQIAASMEKEGDKLEQLQGVMRLIAHDIENGKTTFLKNVKTKADVETLLKFAKRIKGDRNNLLDEHIRGQQLPNMQVSPYWVKYVAERIKNVPGQKRFAEKMLKLAKKHEKLATNTVPPITERYRDDLERLVKLGKEHGDKYHTDYIKEAMADRKRLEKMGITSDEYFRSAMREFKKYLNNTGVSEEELKQRELKQRVSEAARMNIPSYFPTPKPVVSRMIEDADIKPGMRVLEPSAGAGHIADELKKTGAHVDTVEQNETLRQILKDKDHNLVGSDFLQYNPKEKYDRIVMNPPFEKLQDVDHVLHAFKLLKPGGKLVAIMSESPFYRQDKKAQQFREFFDEMGGESEKLPGAFKEGDRSTGVNSRKVIIEKPDDYVDKSLILDPLLKSMQELRDFVTNW